MISQSNQEGKRKTNREPRAAMWHAVAMPKPRTPPNAKAIQIGRRIATAREKLRMSQDEMARMLKVSKGAVGQWEIAYTLPRPARMKRLADVLGVSMEWLLTGDEPEEKVRAQTVTELAVLQIVRSLPPEKQAAALAMLRGLAATVTTPN
jgi:transcriptional regulator with XRE-family HTH domain